MGSHPLPAAQPPSKTRYRRVFGLEGLACRLAAVCGASPQTVGLPAFARRARSRLKPLRRFSSLPCGAAAFEISAKPRFRAGGIRTPDPLHPMQVRCQTAPQPDMILGNRNDGGKEARGQGKRLPKLRVLRERTRGEKSGWGSLARRSFVEDGSLRSFRHVETDGVVRSRRV